MNWPPLLSNRADAHGDMQEQSESGSRAQMVYSRLYWRDKRPGDFSILHVTDLGDVIQIYYRKGKHTGLVDDTARLFPSDELITRLRLIQGE